MLIGLCACSCAFICLVGEWFVYVLGSLYGCLFSRALIVGVFGLFGRMFVCLFVCLFVCVLRVRVCWRVCLFVGVVVNVFVCLCVVGGLLFFVYLNDFAFVYWCVCLFLCDCSFACSSVRCVDTRVFVVVCWCGRVFACLIVCLLVCVWSFARGGLFVWSWVCACLFACLAVCVCVCMIESLFICSLKCLCVCLFGCVCLFLVCLFPMPSCECLCVWLFVSFFACVFVLRG